jgi:O-antigen/teichoic acid export membrane protein
MMSTAVMAFFGFFFWILNARLFSTEQIGIATAIISVTTLIANISLLGQNQALIRFLPKAKNPDTFLNTSLTLVTTMAIVSSISYVLLTPLFSPELSFIRQNLLFTLILIITSVGSTLSLLLDAVFIARRTAGYVLLKNTILSSIKMVLPLVLVVLGSMGIVTATGGAFLVAIALSFVLLTWKTGYRYIPKIDIHTIREMFRFSGGNYLAVLVSGLPANILPIIILNSLGAESSAFFYMVLMIISLLNIIPFSAGQSLLAEGSYDNNHLRQTFIRTIKMVYTIYIPAMLIIMLLGPYILLAFGRDYSVEGITLLRIMAGAGLFVCINSLSYALLNVLKKTSFVTLLTSVQAVLILGLSTALTDYGLYGIGISYITGIGITSIAILTVLFYNVRFFKI